MEHRKENLQRIRNVFQHLSYLDQRTIWQQADGNEERLHDLISESVERRTVSMEEISSAVDAVMSTPCKICDDELVGDGKSVKYDCGHSFHFSCTSRYLSERMRFDMTYLLDCPACSADRAMYPDRAVYPHHGKLYLSETDRIKAILNGILSDEIGEETSTLELWREVWNRYFYVVEENVLRTASRISFTCSCSESSEVHRLSTRMLCCCQCNAEYCSHCSIRTSQLVEYHAPVLCERYAKEFFF